MLHRMGEAGKTIGSHFAVHSTDPQTLAYALVDSPVGTAAWLWERRRAWSDCGGDLLSVFDKDSACDLVTVYWLTRSIGTSLRLYFEEFNSDPTMTITLVNDRKPVIPGPVAYAVFPKDLLFFPKAVVEKNVNLKRWTVMPQGGHFGFAEQPQRLVDDIRSFFREIR